MANAPATALVEAGNPAANVNMPVTVNAEPSNELFSGFINLNLVRQFALMLGLAASVAIGFAVVLWSQSEDYQPIYGNMEGYDLTVLMETLDSEQIEYRIAPNSGVILVPSDDISSIRLRLAAAGISRYDGTGYELLDEEQGLGTSQFMEASRFKRSQEGELQRTISSFKNIQSARIHIAIPERSVFVRSSRKPTASVFLVLNSGANLGDSQADAIANLVASSVPELNKEDVTIVDQRGNLLTRKELNTPLDVASKQFDYVSRLEGSLVGRVNSILLPVVGIDGFKAEVTANVDFTRSEQADEIYDPDTQVIRSEQSMSEQRPGSSRDGGIAGALSNQPPLDGSAPEVATGAGAEANDSTRSNNSMQQSTRNYELGRTISYTNHDPVKIKRLSVAVVVDHRRTIDSDEALPWNQEELAQLSTLVKDAVGFDEERGDRVTVVNNAFSRIEMMPAVTVALWQQPWVISLAKQLLAGIFVLFLALGVLRPVLKNIANGSSDSRQLALPAAQGGFNDLDGSGAALAAPVEPVIVSKPDGYEQQLKAVKGLVAEDPSRVAQVVKQWISEDGGQ